MIAGNGFLLLVAGLVLLINDDKAEVPEGQEDRGAHAQDDVVGVGGELLLPELLTLGIAVLRVVDAQTVAEDTAQAVHHLHRQRYLGQQVKHLLVAVNGLLNKVDVDLRLSAASHAVQQHHAVLQPLHLQLVQRIGLWLGELLDELRMRLAAHL